MPLTKTVLLFVTAIYGGNATGSSTPFELPTPNRAIFQDDAQEAYYAPTTVGTWKSGTFGCTRSQGWRIHEGIDIKSVKRNQQGEAKDPIFATADGTVVYINPSAGASNYGKYLVIRHTIEKIEVYSLYAHLSQIGSQLTEGSHVTQGQTIGVMGRTTNTSQGISQARAHLHFELNLFLNDRFNRWFKEHYGEKSNNDHGIYNGWNLVGINPSKIFHAQQAKGPSFSLRRFLRNRPELYRVLVPETDFAWLKRYPYLVRRNEVAERDGFAAYEVAFDYNGLPFLLIPRGPSEIDLPTKPRLLSVNEAEYKQHPCRELVRKSGDEWELTKNGRKRLKLLTQ